MKIASWNVNSIKVRKDHVKNWLKESGVDVLLLQELKGIEFPSEEFEKIGYKSEAVTQKTYNGVAILSKHDIDIKLKALPGDNKDEQARYIEADINGLRIIGIYAPNGNPVDSEKYPYKLAWMDRLIERMETLRGQEIPIVIGGDFNIIPEDKDCYDAKVWAQDALFSLPARQKWRSLINLGYTDAFRVHNNKAKQYSFWDYQAGAWPKNNGIRIDHFLLSPEYADKLKACSIDAGPRGLEKASDHTPIIVEISI